MSFFQKILDKFIIKNDSPKEPDAQTIYFKNGKMYKVYPTDKESWYDARYLVSDGITYDLESVRDIQRIPTPNFAKFDPMMEGFGITGSLDYVIRMKAGAFYNRNEKELCSACLWKSTELMFANKNCTWRKNDYIRLIKWHYKFEMIEEAEKAIDYLSKKGFVFTDNELNQYKKPLQFDTPKKKTPQKEALTHSEKEHAIVENTTIEDMRSLTHMPFVCNTEVKKFIEKGGHPFAYMDIVEQNIEIVKSEIENMNDIIETDLKKYKNMPQNLKIPVGELVFFSKDYGYTRIICTPKTYTGKPTKFPYSLFFATDLSKIGVGDTTHGELSYGQDGKIKKGNIYFYRKGTSTFLTYKNIDGKLTLTSIE